VCVRDLEGVVGAEVDGNEAEPDDARRVHGEADVSRLVEVLRDLARLDRVHRADDDQQHVVDERHEEPLVLRPLAGRPAVDTASPTPQVSTVLQRARRKPLVLHPALQYHLDAARQIHIDITRAMYVNSSHRIA